EELESQKQAMAWERQKMEAALQRRRLEEESQRTAKAHLLEKLRLGEEARELERQRQQAEQLVQMEQQRKMLEMEAIERYTPARARPPALSLALPHQPPDQPFVFVCVVRVVCVSWC